MSMTILNPAQLAERGKKLYEEEFKERYAAGHIGEILAIEIKSRSAYLGKTPLEALNAAEAAQPNGFFHLIRIGSPGVYNLRSGRPNANGRFFR